jgi:hypothetical protein
MINMQSADVKDYSPKVTTGGFKSKFERLDTNAPFRMASVKHMTQEEFNARVQPLLEASTEDLLMVREKTYAVLDRMDELENSGHKIPVIEFEEILRGAAIVEQLLAERMQGVNRGNSTDKIKTMEAM